jgi:A/G-specific adenine glycosylase
MAPEAFALALLEWYDAHGRKDLPWQRNRTPYRVWVSEIMLQQTQVATVIPYFERFMERFPDVNALAAAHADEVMGLWSGLGYYSRARNLHQAARDILGHHGGRFPEQLDEVMALPGIGRSTAGAILAQALGERHPILDGNVKRVLSRFDAIEGWPGQSAIEKRLWARAEELTPHDRLADYTQAIMDLGATVCRRRRPDCSACPVESACRARAMGEPERYPTPKARKTLPVRQAVFLLLSDERGRILLQRRPPAGIWGGLWSLPELTGDNEGLSTEQWCRRRLGAAPKSVEDWPTLRHTFSHFHLDITPRRVWLKGTKGGAVMEAADTLWYKTDLSDQLGLPAPVKRLLDRLEQEREQLL